jgi:hypothetical protein
LFYPIREDHETARGQALAAYFGRFDKNAEVFDYLRLTGKLFNLLRTNAVLELFFGR